MTESSNSVGRVWGIKLGSGGSCVPFCERYNIVGVGWPMVEAAKVAGATREELWSHVRATCTFYAQPREVGKATGQLFRFGQECKQGDYILYYYPPQKCVRICRITSGPLYRDFEIDERTDIWHYRKVEYPVAPIPVLDLYGSL